MNDPDLAATIEARLSEDPDLAATIQRSPRATLESPRHTSVGGIAALASLRETAGSLDGKLNLERTLAKLSGHAGEPTATVAGVDRVTGLPLRAH